MPKSQPHPYQVRIRAANLDLDRNGANGIVNCSDPRTAEYVADLARRCGDQATVFAYQRESRANYIRGGYQETRL